MHAAKGVGLAANQIGVARRVAVVDVGEDAPPPLVLINPRIVQASELQETAEEGCLSIPDVYGEVERPLSIALEALDRDGRPYKVELSGFKARSEEHTSELQSRLHLVCRLLLEKKKHHTEYGC